MAKTSFPYAMIALCAALHMLVDGLCVCCLYVVATGGVGGGVGDFAAMFILYNVLAFLTQPLTGMWADRLRGDDRLLLLSVSAMTVGCGLSIGSLPEGFSLARTIVLAVVLGIGNSLFHVWGGKQTVLVAGNDVRALGLFVSTGALGLAVGVVCCSTLLMGAMLVCMIALSALHVAMDCGRRRAEMATGVAAPALGRHVVVVAVVVLTLFVVFRSFVGQGFSLSVGGGRWAVLLVGITAMAGKMAGGWLARWLGMARSMLMVLLVVLCCYLSAAVGVRLLLLPGLFAINCTMPVTLCLANGVLKGREGLAFGLLAAALVPGYLFAML